MAKKNQFRDEDFTLKLAIVDTIPGAFFLGGMIMICKKYGSLIFAIGASFSLLAGISKVVWKYLMGLKLGNHACISRLFVPFQYK